MPLAQDIVRCHVGVGWVCVCVNWKNCKIVSLRGVWTRIGKTVTMAMVMLPLKKDPIDDAEDYVN